MSEFSIPESIANDHFRGNSNINEGDATESGKDLASLFNELYDEFRQHFIGSASSDLVEKAFVQFNGGHTGNSDQTLSVPDGVTIRVLSLKTILRANGTTSDALVLLKDASTIVNEDISGVSEDQAVDSQLDQDHVDIIGGTNDLIVRATDGGGGDFPPVDVIVEYVKL